MGYGSYSYEAHSAMTAARAAMPTEQVFKQRECHPLMNPRGVKLRESRDSADHPRSLGIVFALDVSGSMGEIPAAIARREMPGFMKTLTASGVADPQVLFSAFSDVAINAAPLQVGQFETTAELMDQWLTWSWLEGGGASRYESYELALYFFAHHTKMDCFEKRQRKGYLFMSGDEVAYPAVKRAEVQSILGESIPSDVPIADVVRDLERTFHPFFLVPDPGRADGVVGKFWRDLLGPRMIVMAQPSDTCAVAAGLVALGEKTVTGLADLGRKLREHGTAKERVEAVVRAIEPWAKASGVAG